MKIYSTPQKQVNPSFGQIKFNEGAKNILKMSLKQKEIKEFEKLVIAQKENPFNVHFHNNKNKLNAIVLLNPNDVFQISQHSQKFYESTIGFIRRCCKKADNINLKSKNCNSSIDDILKKV